MIIICFSLVFLILSARHSAPWRKTVAKVERFPKTAKEKINKFSVLETFFFLPAPRVAFEGAFRKLSTDEMLLFWKKGEISVLESCRRAAGSNRDGERIFCCSCDAGSHRKCSIVAL